LFNIINMLATFIRDPNAGEMLRDSVRFWDVRGELNPWVKSAVIEIDYFKKENYLFFILLKGIILSFSIIILILFSHSIQSHFFAYVRQLSSYFRY